MDPEMLGIGLFGLLGCLLFLFLLLCFQPKLALMSITIKTEHLHRLLRSNSTSFIRKLSRSMTAERSALVVPMISVLREFSLSELQLATGNFSSSNLIKSGHSGDLFSGVLPGGEMVVIKRMHPLTNVKSERDYYLIEMDVYSHLLDQRFLVPIVGHCVEGEEKLLVYEYMANGDLGSILAQARMISAASDYNVSCRPVREEGEGKAVLDRSKGDQGVGDKAYTRLTSHSLDWRHRLKIAQQVAEALSCLHQSSPTPMAHRNIQGSSILLSKGYEVRLGSLSEAQQLEGGELPAYDIYCFGKLLLDLVSGLDISGCCKNKDQEGQAWLRRCLPLLPQCNDSIDVITREQFLREAVDKTLLLQLNIAADHEQCHNHNQYNHDRDHSHNHDHNHKYDHLDQDQERRHAADQLIQVTSLAKACVEPATLQRLTMKTVHQMLQSL